MRKIVLASSSPRRKELLEKIGLKFSVVSSPVEEKLNPRLKPKAQAEELSKQKAKSVVEKNKNSIIVAADTLVVVDNEILGKPTSKEDAKRMLRKLSGKKHTVITGYTIIDTQSNKLIIDSVQTSVYFKKLNQKEIDSYVATGEPMDKAGAYGINEKGAIFIEKIDGDFYNVVGLPISALAQALKKFFVDVLK